MINLEIFKNVYNLLNDIAINISDDVYSELINMEKREDKPFSKELYGCIFNNIKLAKELKRPVCQDTGMLQFFVEVGGQYPQISDIEDSIKAAVKKATKDIPLRPNAIEAFEEINTTTNIATESPYINWEIAKGTKLKITGYLAGGGCSLVGSSKVLMPLDGYEGIATYVIDTVLDRGINACPPLIVGVGVAGCATVASKLSKKALLRPINIRNRNEKAAKLEEILKKNLNDIGIGPLGMTGKESVYSVNIEYGAHHPATLAVGVSISCWAKRCKTIIM